MSLQTIATDLDEFLEDAAPPLEPLTEQQLDQMARSVIDYVMSQVDSDDAPEIVGEAMVVAGTALAEDAGRPCEEIVEHVLQTLERMTDAARRLQ